MKLLTHTIGFLIVLTVLLFTKQYFDDLGLFIQADFTGIKIAGEDKIPSEIPDVIWDTNEDGIQILSGTAYYLIDILKGVLYSIALLFIIIAGFRIITAKGNEDTIKNNRNTIVFSLFGFMVILLADTAVRQVFYGGGEGLEGDEIWPWECLLNPAECATQGSEELLGIVYWGKMLLAVIAFIEIIVSGIKLIMAIGSEDVIEKEKKVFVWIGLGLLLLAINEVVIEKVLYIVDDNGTIKENGRLEIATDLQHGINEFVGVIQFILQFVVFFAFASLVYGGFLMVANFGDDEKVTKAKGIIRDAVIGIIVSFSAYALVSTIVLKAT